MTLDPDNVSKIKYIAANLKNKRRLLFITGAGISADSGLPTYRGIGGLYEGNVTKHGLTIEEALSGDVLRIKPEITWTYLLQIEQSCRNTKFNRGHQVIADLQNYFEEVWVLTQNVDGFHSDAGSHNVIDIHGNLHYLYCMQCDYTVYMDDYATLQVPPSCPKCKDGMLRPDVVLFGEMLPSDKLHDLVRELEQGFDMVFTIGTTSVFPYIMQPVLYAKQQGVPTVEINPGETRVSHFVDYKITSGAADSLAMLYDIFTATVRT